MGNRNSAVVLCVLASAPYLHLCTGPYMDMGFLSVDSCGQWDGSSDPSLSWAKEEIMVRPEATSSEQAIPPFRADLLT